MILQENLVKKRKNQVIKWSFDKKEIQDNTNLLVDFLTRIGFSKEQKIEMFFIHDVTNWIAAGTKSVEEIEKETISNLNMYVKIKGKPALKYFKTENEDGVAPFFSIHGKRKNVINPLVQVVDWDKGKETRQFKTIEEAEAQRDKWSQEIGTEFKRITITENKDKEGNVVRYTVKGFRTNERIKELKAEFLKQFKKELETALIVETKNGFHIYFVIRNGIKSRYKEIQEGLIRKFGSDPVVTDLARILRLPYFYHLKETEDPFFVQVINWGKQNSNGEWITYTQDELINHLELNVSEKHIEMHQMLLPNDEPKTMKKTTPLKLKEKFDVTLSKETMSFVEFVEEIKEKSFSDFFENEEFENMEHTFCCHFHNDVNPSATLYEMKDGKKMYFCYSSNCTKQYRSVIDVAMETLSTPEQHVTFSQTVDFLAQKLGVKLDMDAYQKEKYQELTLNTMWIKNNLECVRKEMSSYPALYSYITRPLKKILKEMILYVLGTPINKDWSYENKPIFFMSYEYISEEIGVSRSLVVKYINLLALLGLVKKLHHADVPKTLYKRFEKDKQAVNYYCLPSFEDVGNEAENMVKRIKEIGFKKGEVDFEYISSSFGLGKAREVFPNDGMKTDKPTVSVTKRKVRKKVEDAMSFMEDYAKQLIRKNKYIKEENLKAKTKKEQFNVYSKEKREIVKRNLFDNELESIYENFKVAFETEGYARVRLSKKVATQLGLKQSEKRGEQIYIWIKK